MLGEREAEKGGRKYAYFDQILAQSFDGVEKERLEQRAARHVDRDAVFFAGLESVWTMMTLERCAIV